MAGRSEAAPIMIGHGDPQEPTVGVVLNYE